jgi:NADH-quinone oxidoreductase subunit C
MTPAWMEGLTARCRGKADYDKTGNTWSVFLLPEELEEAAGRLYEGEFFLEDIAGMDSADGIVAVYHFDHFSRPGRVALYVAVPHETPEIPSISPIFSGAAWHERECHDFFGIRFAGHPDLSPLLAPEDMDGYPLLKEEGARSSLKDLLDPGDMVDRDPDFELFLKGPRREAAGGEVDTVSEDFMQPDVHVES